ncbi:uncharacterized protein BDZ99DRAFT_467605 [Mytilinidion resinicola]|uniref:Uncharacterized protein n=1 Tax=Mytilinidion resinicola TaxID=574789 RepID=A0A6A6Y849_9PEZI|nr:uncharacterized protein BDZ99DRAFT_467605 [Mytilinidion resinicola]KAF2804315.1 hypothetical protein BDZ99DRAFT_467605 [Mytilinidion resinicola]
MERAGYAEKRAKDLERKVHWLSLALCAVAAFGGHVIVALMEEKKHAKIPRCERGGDVRGLARVVE